MELGDVFDRLGFPKHSAEIYAYLEKSGPCSVSTIARDVATHRPAAYRAIAALEAAQLSTRRMFGKRPFYTAESRARIAALFKNVSNNVAELEKESPERRLRDSMGTVRYFEGKNTVAAIFNDVIEHTKRGDTFYRYTSENDLAEVNRLLPTDYRSRRDAKRLERLVISNPESGRQKRSRLERFIKFLDSEKERFHQNAIELLYGRRMAFIDLNTQKGIIIENATLVEFQKTIFRSLYTRL